MSLASQPDAVLQNYGLVETTTWLIGNLRLCLGW